MSVGKNNEVIELISFTQEAFDVAEKAKNIKPMKLSKKLSRNIVDELEKFYGENPEYLDMITEEYHKTYQEI